MFFNDYLLLKMFFSRNDVFADCNLQSDINTGCSETCAKNFRVYFEMSIIDLLKQTLLI